MQLNQEIVAAGLWRNLVDYQVVEGNPVWRFVLVLAAVVLEQMSLLVNRTHPYLYGLPVQTMTYSQLAQ